MEWRGREWSGGEGREGEGRAGQGRVPDCLGGLSRVGISSRSTRPWNGQPPSMCYVRPTLEYSSAALSTATHTNLAKLDNVQNQALRFISGAMRTTPTSACVIECNIELLDIRRYAAIVTNDARYHRVEHHPSKVMIQSWRNNTRIKQQSYLTRATTLLHEYNLQRTREKIATLASQPYQQTLCPHLIVKSASKADRAHILNSLTGETIDTLSNTMRHFYTDGLALNAIQYPYTTRKDSNEAC